MKHEGGGDKFFANVFEGGDVDFILIHFAQFGASLFDAFEKRISGSALLVDFAFQRETGEGGLEKYGKSGEGVESLSVILTQTHHHHTISSCPRLYE